MLFAVIQTGVVIGPLLIDLGVARRKRELALQSVVDGVALVVIAEQILVLVGADHIVVEEVEGVVEGVVVAGVDAPLPAREGVVNLLIGSGLLLCLTLPIQLAAGGILTGSRCDLIRPGGLALVGLHVDELLLFALGHDVVIRRDPVGDVLQDRRDGL